jgi:3D (Asp-Asp-Asp) domain-containing protein
MEGGYLDRKGKPLHTLQSYLAGKSPYVSVAMDSKAFKYGQPLRIPELEKKYGRPIDFRVVDTGGAFKGRGTSRIDIATANSRASHDATVNGPLTLIPQTRGRGYVDGNSTRSANPSRQAGNSSGQKVSYSSESDNNAGRSANNSGASENTSVQTASNSSQADTATQET